MDAVHPEGGHLPLPPLFAFHLGLTQTREWWGKQPTALGSSGYAWTEADWHGVGGRLTNIGDVELVGEKDSHNGHGPS